ncbi:MAG: exodeoxyribonuclease III [Pseudomonadota bacterium]
MKLASWNINSLKVRLEQVTDWLASSDCDVLGLQETKLIDARFPWQALEEAGYDVAFSGQKTYNGVALLAKSSLGGLSDVVTDVPGLVDPQRRIIAATIGDIRVINLYVVNGKEVDSDKFHYKMHWLEKVKDYIEDQLKRHEKVVVMGDFNIAPDDRDVYDPIVCREKILCSTPERQALQKILDLGFTDSFRTKCDEARRFSWWDYRTGGFEKNRGYRIDLILPNKSLQKTLKDSWIDTEPRQWERPSDHTPVVAEFAGHD